ncbi:hypothetical protein FB451DRAFT_284788 [Mycena latifolia]|nr:hypothetical protein FB451DRAFT_284788 [Mycena latifolia]
MDPILTALVQSNEPPSEPQARHVQQILDDTVTSLSDLEEEISKVVLSLLKLEKDRRLRSEYAATLKGVLSPIRCIPSEILAEIFLLCRDDTLDSFRYSVADPRWAPMLLGHVSSRWRQVSRSSPRLWDRFHLQRKSGSRNPPEDLLRSILANSRILPLHVKLDISSPMPPNGLTDENVLYLLFQEHHRLKDIHLDLTSVIDPPPPIFNKRAFPILTSIQILAYRRAIDITHLLASFNNVPQVRSVFINSFSTPNLPLVSALPWSQLTQLALEIPLDVCQARDILAICEMVQDCRLDGLIQSDDPRPSQHVYRLNYLRRFTVSIEDEAHPELFFDAFSLPTLDYLNIRASSWSSRFLSSLYTRSKFALTHLELHLIDMNAENLIQFLRHFPGLQVLHLSYCCIEDALFKAFTYYPRDPVPPFALPHLESLTITDDSPSLTGALIADMAESVSVHCGGRNTAFPALKTVHLWLDGSSFDADVEARLVSACASGSIVDHLKRE